MLGPVLTAYEHAMTEVGRNTWRTDRYSPCPRREAGQYLALLASLGYQLSAIEQALADDIPYTGDEPADDSLPVVGDSPDTDSPDQAPGRREHARAPGSGDQPPAEDGDHGMDSAA